MAILFKKKATTYQDGGKTKKKKIIGDKGKDYKGASRLASGGFGKPTEVSGKELKAKNKQDKKAKRLAKRAK